MPLEVPRDRRVCTPTSGEYCRRLPGFDDKVIHLFARDVDPSNSCALYGVDVGGFNCPGDDAWTEWQHRPLAHTYATRVFGCDPCQGSRSGCRGGRCI